MEKRPSVSTHWILLGVVVAVALLLGGYEMSVMNARKTASRNRTLCASNISQLCKAIMLYQDVNGGALPEQLGQLVPSIVTDPRVLHSPQSDEPPPNGPSSATNYLYVRANNTGMPSYYIFGPRKPGEHGFNLGNETGSVEWIELSPESKKKFVARLEAQFIPVQPSPSLSPAMQDQARKLRELLELDK